MTQATRPVLSVIVRKFRKEFEHDVERSLIKVQQAVTDQPGFAGLQNSFSFETGCCELVTVVAFDTGENLERWKKSTIRENLVAELDKYSLDNATHAQFGDLALLVHPTARVSKIETVLILIFWIMILGGPLRYLADSLLPRTVASLWQNVLLVSVTVALISYVFLPWSSLLLTRLKARIFRRQ